MEPRDSHPPAVSARRRLARGQAAGLVAIFAIANVFLFPVTADGCIAAFDGLKYGVGAEHAPRESISGHHPLFHVVVLGLTEATRALGIHHPGHIAARIFVGACAGLFVVLVLNAAGKNRLLAGAAFAGAAVITRMFVIETGVAESTIPGYVAAIWVFIEALRPDPGRARLVFSLVVALLLRQDNVLILPGVAVALLTSSRSPGRGRLVVAVLAISAAITAAAYVACWLVATGGKTGLFAYLTELAVNGPWEGPRQLDLGRVLLHVDALGAALVGRSWALATPNLWLGPLWLAGVALAAILLRGDRAPIFPAVAAVAATVLARLLFFTWFEASNPEWALFVICVAAWLGARAARGAPRHGKLTRAIGGSILALAAAIVLVRHAGDTIALRRTTFVDNIAAVRRSCPSCNVIAHGPAVQMACTLLGIEFEGAADTSNPAADIEYAASRIRETRRDTLFIFDRAMLTMDPFTSGKARENPLFLDGMESTRKIEIHKVGGRAFAVTYRPNE